MKRLVLFVFVACFAFCSTYAGGVRRPGSVVLQHHRIVNPIPTIDPFSDPMEEFSLYATTDALELTSESAQGNAWISVTGPTGVVYSSMESMTIGSELFISVEDFPAGAYTISILYNATIYVGEFEVE